MTNAPFRAAFWTMCCAVLLSVAMIASSPEAGRLVNQFLHPELAQQATDIAIPEVVLGQEERLSFPVAAHEPGTHVPVPDPYAQPTPADPRPEVASSGSSWPATYSPPAVSGVRTASADPNVVLGLIEQQTPVTSREHTSPVQATVTTPPIEIVTTAETPAMHIPVPEPEMSHGQHDSLLSNQNFPEPELQRLQEHVTQLRMAQIERELAEVRSAERGKFHRLADGELSAIHDRLQEFCGRFAPAANGSIPTSKTAQSQVLMTLAANGDATDMAPAGADRNATALSEEPESEDSEPTITITETTEAGLYDISIHNMEVGDVFRQLGKKLGWRVIIAPEVSGKFTGEFHEADIEQAFVMVVKTHKLGVDRRGDYILIRQHSGHAVR